MYWELVDNGLADSASCDSDERDGTGCFSAYVSTTPDKLDRVVEIARSIVDSALDFSDADLARAKAKVEARVVLNGELPMGRLMALGLEWNYREAVTPLSEIVRLIRAVNREDISNVLERYPLTALAEYRLLPEV
jgi:predicted Zn-dependent peptidase